MADPATNRGAPGGRAGKRAVPRRAVRSGRLAIVVSPSFSAGSVAEHLQSSTFQVTSLDFRSSLLSDLSAVSPDVVILEYGGPHDFDLVRVCRDLSGTMAARVVVVSAIDDDPDHELEIAALDAGADDYISASLAPPALRARVRAALRGKAAAEQHARLDVGDVTIDVDGHVLYIAGAPVRCPALHFALLVELAINVGRVVGRESLWSTVWGSPVDSVDPRRVRQAISALRGVLGAGAHRPRIETMGSAGYRLVAATAGEPGSAEHRGL